MPRKKLGAILNSSANKLNVPVISLAAADIGSNAVRLLFATVTREEDGETKLTNTHTLRLPVRIGGDVFTDGVIRTQTRDRLTAAMKVFSGLVEIYKPDRYLVCGTSALREGSNGKQVTDFVRRKTGIRIHCISGRDEANFLYEGLIHCCDLPEASRYLHIDVGGGSTELILGTRHKFLTASSFRIGSVRKLKSDCAAEQKRMHAWLDRNCSHHRRLALTASGGNIKHLYGLLANKAQPFIVQSDLAKCHRQLSTMNVSERVRELGMRPDRADIVVPATEIYLSVMNRLHRQHLYVPKINLVSCLLVSLMVKPFPA